METISQSKKFNMSGNSGRRKKREGLRGIRGEKVKMKKSDYANMIHKVIAREMF